MNLGPGSSAAHFFSYTTEYRDIQIAGLNYEDDFAGNALAAMVKPGIIEFRHHRAFSDRHVQEIAARIVMHSGGEFASRRHAEY